MIDTLNTAVRIHGPAAVSQRLGVAMSSLRRWRSAGDVPEAHHEGLQALAKAPTEVVPPGHKLRGVSSLVRPDGSIAAQWVKTTAQAEDREAVIARLLAAMPGQVEPLPEIEAESGGGHEDRLAVYPMGDPHVGMLAWAPESGAAFDLQIAEDLMVRAAQDLVLRGPRTRDALIVNLGDFWHSDNAQGHTTKGDHALDLDGRAAKVLTAGIRIFGAMIDTAARHHPGTITVDCRIGNHDGHTSILLALAMQERYRNTPRIVVPLPTAHRAYHEFGRNLVGTTHGDRAKGADLVGIMAAENPEAWGRTRHRVWLCGHVHHTSVKEHLGVKVETFRTLAARDAWHAGQGYVTGRDMVRIVLHRDHGEVSRETVNVSALLGTA